MHAKAPAFISVFAGRIADTGTDPIPLMLECKKILKDRPQAELLWASVREVLNIFQANDCGCEIVTVPHDILNKALKLAGNGFEGTLARHGENVRRRREGGGIFPVEIYDVGFTIYELLLILCGGVNRIS